MCTGNFEVTSVCNINCCVVIWR